MGKHSNYFLLELGIFVSFISSNGCLCVKFKVRNYFIVGLHEFPSDTHAFFLHYAKNLNNYDFKKVIKVSRQSRHATGHVTSDELT